MSTDQPTVGGRTATQLMDEAVKKAYATAIAAATLAGMHVSQPERSALKAGASAGAATMFTLLNEAGAIRLDGDR